MYGAAAKRMEMLWYFVMLSWWTYLLRTENAILCIKKDQAMSSLDRQCVPAGDVVFSVAGLQNPPFHRTSNGRPAIGRTSVLNLCLSNIRLFMPKSRSLADTLMRRAQGLTHGGKR